MVAYPDPTSGLKEALAEVVAFMEARDFAAALARLDGLPAADQARVVVVSFRCEILMAQGDWPRAALIAEALATADPRNPAHWVHWAFATRRSVSLKEAERILREAHELHADVAVITFNLACYCAQSQRLEEALAWLQRAVKQEAAYAKLARNDPDLAPLRDWLPPGHAVWHAD